MSREHFFERPAGLTIGEIARMTGATPRAGTTLDHRISDIAPLDRAGPADVVFIDTAKHASALTRTRAGVCLTAAEFETNAPSDLNVLLTPRPFAAFVIVASALFPEALRPRSLFGSKGIA